MKLLVEFCERSSCYAALHSSDASEICKASGTRHFCRALRVQCTGRDDAFVGWMGDQCLSPGLPLMRVFEPVGKQLKSSNPMVDHHFPHQSAGAIPILWTSLS